MAADNSQGPIWNAIDTAPKDGTRIIVFRPTANEYCHHIDVDYWRDGCWMRSPDQCKPTHWLPFPEPPKEG